MGLHVRAIAPAVGRNGPRADAEGQRAADDDVRRFRRGIGTAREPVQARARWPAHRVRTLPRRRNPHLLDARRAGALADGDLARADAGPAPAERVLAPDRES